ncbi:MAG: hypothetical protein ABFS24_13745 [Pseudomonadota bacterium]
MKGEGACHPYIPPEPGPGDFMCFNRPALSLSLSIVDSLMVAKLGLMAYWLF